MCVAFHPEQPGVIAGGTFSGNLCVVCVCVFMSVYVSRGTHTLPCCMLYVMRLKCLNWSYSGELRVWNIGAEGDPLVATSHFSNLVHQEPVSKVPSWSSPSLTPQLEGVGVLGTI